MDEIEAIERYIILLLGSVDSRPIPSATHLQKELFVLSKANKKMQDIIDFEKHHFGPYSSEIDSVSKNPVHFSDAFVFDSNLRKLYLTDKGKGIYDEIRRQNQNNPGFSEFHAMIQMVRNLYDRLTTKELLFLIYSTYEDYTEKSSVSNDLLSSPKREMLAKSLLRRGLITEERYAELVGTV